MTKNKKNLTLFFLLFFLNGCGYKPILKGIDYDFTIKVGTNTGDKQINSKVENKIKIVDGTKRTFNLDFSSKETKNILSKDSKGDPNILELVININYKLSENGKILVHRSYTQRSTYNNISDKFELSKSEEILRNNLVENLVSDIINSASNLILNPMINDN